jgi:membrane-bound metal-dependent hydrolase YbcI (DUF457 family)
VEYYDHALLGATVALATGAQRRHGLAIVLTAAAAGALPDWDSLPRLAVSADYGSVHRVWGHNLLVAPLLSGLVGALGYLCWASAPRPPGGGGRPLSGRALAVWVVLGVLVALSHLLADVVYCGVLREPDWPVALLWPFSGRGWARPLVPWSDRGVTWILGGALIGACLWRRAAQTPAVLGLLAVAGYIAFRGVFPGDG